MDESTKRIVLLGKTGYGKSSLGNTIFGEKVFTVNHSSKSGTRKCKAETRSVHGRSITLIDTPGFFDTDMPEDDLKAEIMRCIVECAPGAHAFLNLLEVEKISEQEKEIIKKAEEYFGDEVCKYATLVFTRGDQLDEGQTIEDFLSEDQSLMEKFAGRCHVIDNKYWNTENPEDEYRSNKFQVEQLLKSVDKTIKLSKGCFTNKMLQIVEVKIQDEREQIRSSSENMSEEEIEKRAKESASGKLLILLASISTGVLLGALLGVKKMVEVVVQEVATGLTTVTGDGGAVAAALAAAGAGARQMVVPAVVAGLEGGARGYNAAKDAKTPLEAIKMAALAINDEAYNVTDETEKSLTDRHSQKSNSKKKQ